MKTFIVLLVINLGCGYSFASIHNLSERISNGYPAQEGKAPYIVGLNFSLGSYEWWCGGSIIDHNWILTAGHCIGAAKSVIINFGATWRTHAQFTHTVENHNFFRHPEFNGINNDIALIRIPYVEFYRLVDKVDLPSIDDQSNNFNGSWAVACGWGGTYDGGPMQDWLHCADLQIIDNTDCQAYYGSVNVNNGTICTKTQCGKSTCGRDSGGPLVAYEGAKLVGITSFGSIAGCQSGAPAAFARVTTYLDWIYNITITLSN